MDTTKTWIDIGWFGECRPPGNMHQDVYDPAGKVHQVENLMWRRNPTLRILWLPSNFVNDPALNDPVATTVRALGELTKGGQTE